MSEIWNLSTICRCCHSDGYFKSLLEPHNTPEGIQTYETLLRHTFGLTISQPGIEASYNICDSCMSRIKDATSFRKQVLECEVKFQEYCKNEQHCDVNIVKLEDSNQDTTWDNDLPPSPTISIPIKEEIKYEEDIKDIPLEVKNEEPKPKSTTNKDTRIEDVKIKKEKKKSKVSDENRMRILELTVSGKKMFSCKTCGGVYAMKRQINAHIKEFHRNTYDCHCCGKKFTHKGIYKQHIQTHTNLIYFECDICGKRVSRKNSLIDHINSHTDIRKYTCIICNKTYKNKSTLNIHLKWHNGLKKKVLCDLCGRSFNDKTNLNIHIKIVHLKIRSFHCDICGRSYTAKKHLKAHIIAHMQSSDTVNKPVFTCDVCRKPFKCPRSFESHRMLHDNKYQCRICRQVSSDKESYTAHLRTHFKSVTCPVCCKVFTTPYAMKRHMDAHNGIKRHACEICGYKFIDKAQVKRHMLRKHNPNYIEKVQCDICKRHVTDLTKHMEGHRNKKFACEYCGKSYVENNALNRHKKVIHFGRIFTCDICKKNYMSMKSVTRHKLRVHKIKNEDVIPDFNNYSQVTHNDQGKI